MDDIKKIKFNLNKVVYIYIGIKVMNKPKTIFCDIDGTLTEYPYSSEMGDYNLIKRI